VLNTEHDDSLKVQTPSGVCEDWRRLKRDSATGHEPRHVSRIRRDWKHGLGADPSLTASFSPIAVVVVVLSPRYIHRAFNGKKQLLVFLLSATSCLGCILFADVPGDQPHAVKDS